MTRSDENGIYESSAKTIRKQKISDMKKRAQIGNTSNAEIFVSIHMNKIEQNKYFGWQTFYKENDENSKYLASHIQQNLNYYISKENNRKIKKINRIYLSEHVEIPFALVECGFLSNLEENKLLQTDEYQNKLAWSIYTGIMDYFSK